jgi:hypothetical protein
MKSLLPFLFVLAMLSGPSALATDTMRCKNHIVSDGDPKAKVADLCGEPTHIEQRTIVRSGVPRRYLNGSGDASVSDRELLIVSRSHVEVQVDVWLYNLGKRRLMREVVFIDSRVVEINVLGRGY